MGAAGRSTDVKEKTRPHVCACEDLTRCQRDTNPFGCGVAMPTSAAERRRWYIRLCPDQTPAARAKLARKWRSHRVAIEHFEQDGLYWTPGGQLRKTVSAFPSRAPNPLPSDWVWATQRDPNRSPRKRRRERAALDAVRSPLLKDVAQERDRLQQENAELLKQRELAEQRVKELEEELQAAKQDSVEAVQNALESVVKDKVLSYEVIVASEFLQSKVCEWTGFASWEIAMAYYDLLNFDGAAGRLILWDEHTGYDTVMDEGEEPAQRKRVRHSRPTAHKIDSRSAFGVAQQRGGFHQRRGFQA